MEFYGRKKDSIAQRAFPVVSNVYQNQGEQYVNIVIPFTDGLRSMNVVVNLKDSFEKQCSNLPLAFEKNIVLAIIDNLWKEHLRDLDELKQSVQNASYEQKDPLLIYKFESFELFKTLLDKVNREVVSFLFKADLPNAENTKVSQAPERRQALRTQESRPEQAGPTPPPVSQGGAPAPPRAQQPSQPQAPVRVENKVGRNDPCPCGSGKKFKQCHGKAQPA